jgi:hypothetical protein
LSGTLTPCLIHSDDKVLCHGVLCKWHE